MDGALNDMTKVYFGGDEIGAVYDYTSQIWPAAYSCLLYIVLTAPAGQSYTYDHIPAAGGNMTAVYMLRISDATTGSVITTIDVTDSVTTTLQEQINGQWTTPQNFSLTYNSTPKTFTWTANNRARNGINQSSGTTQPTNAPARSSRVVASYSGTYNGVAVSGSTTDVMTQNANNVTIGTAQYQNFQFSVQNSKWTSSNPGAASQNSATLSASVDQKSQCTFDSGYTYDYMVYNAATTTDFSFSSENWITFSGATATMASRGTDYDTNKRSAVIYCTLHGSAMGNITVYQAKNDRSTEYDYIDFALWTSPASLTSVASSFSVYGTLGYKYRYHYDSGSYSSWSGRTTTTAVPTITNVSPTPTSYSGNSVSVPANSGSSTRTYTVTANYTDPNGGNWNGYQVEIDQDYVAYTYENPTVTIGYDTIGPAANTEYPTVSVSQRVFQGSTLVATLTGTLYGGATSGTASGGGLSAQFSVSYSGSARSGTGASFNSTNGGVTTASRGTTEGSAREVAYNIYVTATINGKSGSNSTAATATQGANVATPVAAQYQSVSIQSLSTYSITSTCANTAVTATVKASWRDAGTKYSAYDDGDTTAYTGMTQHTNETVTGTNGVTMRVNNATDYSNSSNQFYVNNLHNTSQASHSVVAKFGGLTSESKTVTQKADSIVTNQTKDWHLSVSIGSNQIWAGGGTATVAYTAYHTKYSYWQSGGATDVVSGSEETVNDTPSLSLTDMSSSGAFSLSGTTVTHRDMQKNVTTDSVKVHAATAGATDDVLVSIINILTDNTVNGSWGSTYNVDHDYGIKTFTISNYTSRSTEAPFTGGETAYSVVGSHIRTPYHDRPVYKKYSSWSSANNDDNHREYYTTESEAYGGDTEITGDAVTLSTSLSWVTIDTTNSKLIISAQSSGGTPRAGYVDAKNVNGGSWFSQQVFQGGYASISRTPQFLIFDAAGGTKTFKVSWEYTSFDVTYPRPTITMPSLTIFPGSGGSSSGTGETTITVYCEEKDQYITDMLIGTITIHPQNSALSDLTIRVTQ